MELIGKLKKDVENSKDIKEARDIMEKAGMRLTNEELQQISGGTGGNGVWGSEVFYVYSSNGTYVYNNIDLTGEPLKHLDVNTKVTKKELYGRKNVCKISYLGGEGYVSWDDIFPEPFPV